MTTIYVKNFSKYPGARYKRLGPFSGEEFRDEVLIPEMKKHENLIINLDGVIGYGSSFLEEVFGGLIRLGEPENKVLSLLKNLVSNDDPLLISEITAYVKDAIQVKKNK